MKITLELKGDQIIIGVPNDLDTSEYVEFYKKFNSSSMITQVSKALQDQAHKELDKQFFKVYK